MEILIIIALIVAGLILFLIEVFLVPGITIAGIASACSLLYAIYYAFSDMGMQAGFITLSCTAAGIIGITVWVMRSKTVDRLSLKKELDFRPEPLKGLDIRVGDRGTSATRRLGTRKSTGISSRYNPPTGSSMKARPSK